MAELAKVHPGTAETAESVDDVFSPFQLQDPLSKWHPASHWPRSENLHWGSQPGKTRKNQQKGYVQEEVAKLLVARKLLGLDAEELRLLQGWLIWFLEFFGNSTCLFFALYIYDKACVVLIASYAVSDCLLSKAPTTLDQADRSHFPVEVSWVPKTLVTTQLVTCRPCCSSEFSPHCFNGNGIKAESSYKFCLSCRLSIEAFTAWRVNSAVDDNSKARITFELGDPDHKTCGTRAHKTSTSTQPRSLEHEVENGRRQYLPPWAKFWS